MNILKIVLWFVLTAVVYCVLFSLWNPLRRKNKKWITIVGIASQVVLAVAAAYICISASRILPRYFYCVIAMFYTALLADAATELVFFIITLLGKRGAIMIVRLVAGIAVTLGYLAYMVFNSQIVTPNYLTYKSDKLTRDHKIVFISDLHYGNTQTKGVVERTLENIKKEKPEILLLGGDITDEFTSKEDMKDIYSKIGALGIPTYFVYGNHDRQNHGTDIGGRTYTDNELEDAIESSGITSPQDKYIVFDDIVILGREDYDSDKRTKVENLRERPKGKYVINVDHSPYQYEDIKKTNADLQLSGHVHAGQMFPLRTLYTFAVDNICGSYRSGNTDIYVSSGFSGWCFPLRSEGHCNYEVINLKKS